MATPTWKDTYYSTTADTLEFTIQDSSSVLFRGQAMKPSSKDTQRIRVNNICEPYLDPLIEPSTTLIGTFNSSSRSTFYLYTGTTRQANYDLVWCRDHDIKSLSTGDSLNVPVNTKRAAGQLDITSTLTASGATHTFRRSTGDDCGDWAIYYINQRGGYDSLLLQGITTSSIASNQVTTELVYDNNTLQSGYGRHTKPSTTYTANTGWISDKESRTIAKHLLSTPSAYLHDLRNDTVTPVLLSLDETQIARRTIGNMASYSLTLIQKGETISLS